MKKEKKHPGPPVIKLNASKAESIAAMGGTNGQIAAALGVSEGTLFNVRKRDQAVDEAIKNGKDKADLLVVSALYKAALAGDTTAMIFWLKNRKPEQWRDNQHSVAVDNHLTVEVIHTRPEHKAKK